MFHLPCVLGKNVPGHLQCDCLNRLSQKQPKGKFSSPCPCPGPGSCSVLCCAQFSVVFVLESAQVHSSIFICSSLMLYFSFWHFCYFINCYALKWQTARKQMDTEMKHSQNPGTLVRLLKVMKEERIANDSCAEEHSQSPEQESRDTAQSHQQHTPWRIIWSDPSMEWELPALQSSPECMWQAAPKCFLEIALCIFWSEWENFRKNIFIDYTLKLSFICYPIAWTLELLGFSFNMKTKFNNSS